GAGVRRQLVLTGDLEGGHLVVAVVEQFVVRLRGSGQLVERLVDGRVVLPRPAFYRGQVAVERGLDRLGSGAYLGSGGLRSIRHIDNAILYVAQSAELIICKNMYLSTCMCREGSLARRRYDC